jgi:D-alanyl-D-alanine dipeptidase
MPDMKMKYITKICITAMVIFVFISGLSFAQEMKNSPLPSDSRQMVLVLTDSVKAVKGFLYFFEKDAKNNSWKQSGQKAAVVLGKNGLGWGQGYHTIDPSKLPVKKEGDGRSPAGVFSLGAGFGYADSLKMKGLNIPYISITEMLECIDDSSSKFYNKLVMRNEADTVDWSSSEKMNHVGIWYDLGIMVNHNTNPYIKGFGSCIFIHNWADPNETSSGCTEMDPVNMKELIYKLNSKHHPALVQLTKQLYKFYKIEWGLPDTALKLP